MSDDEIIRMANKAGWGYEDVTRATADLHIEAESLRTGLTFALTREQDAVEQAQRLLAERDEACAEVERLRADAERYRWLRQRYPALTTMQAARGVGLDLSRTFVNTAEKFDAAIDAARNALKEPK
jgi:hypothetical protein